MQAPIFPCSFYLSQLHPIQILRFGDVEVDLDAVAAGQGHGFDEMGGDELALGRGRVVKHFRPGKELLMLLLQLLGEPVAVGQSRFQRFDVGSQRCHGLLYGVQSAFDLLGGEGTFSVQRVQHQPLPAPLLDMLFGKLQLGLPDLLLQIRCRCADLIADDVVLADSSGLLQNIPNKLADNGIYLFGTVGGGAITVSFVLGAIVAFVDSHTPITAIGGVMGLPCC